MIRIRREEIVGWQERRLGELVHRALDLLVAKSLPMDRAIKKAVIECLSEREREAGMEFLRGLFAKAELSPDWQRFLELFSSRERLTELDLLASEGQRFRADLVLVGSPTVVLDYKYARPRNEHREQVENYCRILERIFGPIEGYLLYLSPEGARLEKVV